MQRAVRLPLCAVCVRHMCTLIVYISGFIKYFLFDIRCRILHTHATETEWQRNEHKTNEKKIKEMNERKKMIHLHLVYDDLWIMCLLLLSLVPYISSRRLLIGYRRAHYIQRLLSTGGDNDNVKTANNKSRVHQLYFQVSFLQMENRLAHRG